MLHAINWQLFNYFGSVCSTETLHSAPKKFGFSKAALRRKWFICGDDERILFDSDVCQSTCDDFYGSYSYLNINDL